MTIGKIKLLDFPNALEGKLPGSGFAEMQKGEFQGKQESMGSMASRAAPASLEARENPADHSGEPVARSP